MANTLAEKIDDHALEAVPLEDRKSWVSLTWNTTGIVTTLVILFFGALVCFAAGVRRPDLSGARGVTDLYLYAHERDSGQQQPSYPDDLLIDVYAGPGMTPSAAAPVLTEVNPPAVMILSNALRSTTRSLTTGNPVARHGSMTSLSPSR